MNNYCYDPDCAACQAMKEQELWFLAQQIEIEETEACYEWDDTYDFINSL